MRSHTVAVVVPLSDRDTLTPDEEISLRHVVRYLGRYDKFFVAPDGVKPPHRDFAVKRFPRRFFGSAAAHTRLMLSRGFYRAFDDYEYILLHHLDAIALEDRLEEWCAAGPDYVGPPWLPCEDLPWAKVGRVGNGGFSLRRVESFLKVLNSPLKRAVPPRRPARLPSGAPRLLRYRRWLRTSLDRLPPFNGVRWRLRNWRRNEDLFWSFEAQHFYPPFRVASFKEGLRFAFEAAPRLCFELNGNKLPFGAHAWPKYDRAFWEPYLLS